jgi:hypothetical protein
MPSEDKVPLKRRPAPKEDERLKIAFQEQLTCNQKKQIITKKNAF